MGLIFVGWLLALIFVYWLGYEDSYFVDEGKRIAIPLWQYIILCVLCGIGFILTSIFLSINWRA